MLPTGTPTSMRSSATDIIRHDSMRPVIVPASPTSRTTLDRKRIEALLRAAVQRLEGEWLLLGGALVVTWLDPRRRTEDVDLVGLKGTQSERLALLELAAEEGLPVEAVNSAADFFVRQVPDWEERHVPFRKGKSARIDRPTATLFIELKMRRLSQRDLSDCRLVLRKAPAREIDVPLLRQRLDALPPTEDLVLARRRKMLRRALDNWRHRK